VWSYSLEPPVLRAPKWLGGFFKQEFLLSQSLLRKEEGSDKVKAVIPFTFCEGLESTFSGKDFGRLYE
jgi:hypothetical protein